MTQPTTAALSGLTVIDLTRILAGPFCTMLLSDLGARVIKVEQPPQGDDARAIGPFVEGESAYFASLNRGKESIALDLNMASHRLVFERLLERGDVLIENFRPGRMAAWGYGQSAVRRRWPQLIYASISGFGADGPERDRPAYDIVVQAMGGMMSVTGEEGGAGVRVGTSIGDIAAGLFAAVGILSALYARRREGEGGAVDVAMLDCQVAILENALARYFAGGETPGPLGARHPSITPFDAFLTRNRRIVIACGNDKLFARLSEVLACPGWTMDERFTSNDARTRNHAALKRLMEEALADHDAAHWLALLHRHGIPASEIKDMAELARDPQLKARNMLVTVEGGKGGGFTLAGNPVKIAGRPDPRHRPPPPTLDEGRHRLLAELGIKG